MAISDIHTEGKFCQFIREYADCLEILLFLAKHPRTRFNQLAIVQALNTQKVYIEGALNRLINDGLVRRYTVNNFSSYSLADDETLLNSVPDIVKLNLFRWQLLHREPNSSTVE